jgi:hypothetical protein
MNPSEIEKNLLWRIIAKFYLNCLWGKFPQLLKLPKFQYLTEELQQKLQDATLEIKGTELLENTEHSETDMMLISYQEKKPNSWKTAPLGTLCWPVSVRNFTSFGSTSTLFRYGQYFLSKRRHSV